MRALRLESLQPLRSRYSLGRHTLSQPSHRGASSIRQFNLPRHNREHAFDVSKPLLDLFGSS
jgi:hypothetical protein